MKRLLLACDDYIYRYEGKYFAANNDRNCFYQRYLRVFDSIRLVARCEEIVRLTPEKVLIDESLIQVVPISMFHGPKQYLKKYFTIRKELKGVFNSIDAAVLRLPSTVANRVGQKLIKTSIPYITEIVYDAYDDYKNTRNLFFKFVFGKIDYDMRNLCYNADGVSCVTQNYLQQRYFTKKETGFSTYYSSVALNRGFYSSPRQFPIKERFLISHVANEVSFMGRKGHKEILEMLSALKRKGYLVDVSFAGRDYNNGITQLKNYAKQLGIEDQVFFAGYLSREELREYLLKSDIFVFPTKAEGLPRVVIEAMAVGLPCVTSNVSGNPELIRKEFLFNINDNNKMRDIVLGLISNSDLYENASRENYEKSLSYEESVLQKRRDEMYSFLKSKCTEK